MTADSHKHVFVSYVHEDQVAVDQIVKALEAAGIPVWLDRQALAPGDRWKDRIREAIQQDALIFMPLFSAASQAKNRSGMNEELAIALDEARKMTPGQKWIIPVRLDDTPFPTAWWISEREPLSHLQYLDLFGTAFPANIIRLVDEIRRQLGQPAADPAGVLTVIREAGTDERAIKVKQLVKEMLPNSSPPHRTRRSRPARGPGRPGHDQ